MIVYNDMRKGQLGNQLFFVASTIGIALKNNTTYGFTANLGYHNKDYQKIFKYDIPNQTTYVPKKQYHQEEFSYYDVVINEDVELYGYFQSERFFKHCEDLIRKQFEFKDEYVNNIKNKYDFLDNTCSVHIRRGDYVNQPNHHPLTPIKYYEKILNKIKGNYKKIIFFSDDNDWVSNQFKDDKYIIPEFDEDYDLNSFILMSLCQDNIICNSTFSWWAAWLNKNPNKRVFAPDPNTWFGKAYDHFNPKDIIPKEWEIIKV